ncbi:MAG TPA: proline iminopeptidase-family hydrolase [Streptosporangiaceae bacterium]
MTDDLPVKEGHLAFAGYRTWYRIVGDAEGPGKFPLLCLHGGPGATWHHMEPYTELAADGRRVICYDQLGCGNSAITEDHDPSIFTTELFLEELALVRVDLGLDRCHVLGHSWGGMLGMAYAATRPPGLVSLVAESSPPSVPFWLTELDKLRAELPGDVEKILRSHEAAGTTDSDEYAEAMVAFYDRHVCRVRPYPDWLDRCFDRLNANPEVYHTMNGPSEFHVIGPLKDFDVTGELGAIDVPTLLFCGEFDEVTPATVALAHERISGSQMVVLPGCSHMGQAERPDLALGLVKGWLAGVESALSH